MAESADFHNPSPRHWRSFWSLCALQAQNAFNDNSVRFILLPLGTALAAQMGPVAHYYQHILAAFLVLPYILFSPITGWMADRFPKNRIINAALYLQTFVFLAIVAAVHLRMIWLATFGFFLLALQSTLLSPAKNGIIKDLVGSQRLNFANGWMEMTLIVAILLGMFSGGWWFDYHYQMGAATVDHAWAAAAAPLWWLTAATLVALALGHGVENIPARLPDARFEPKLVWAHFTELRRLFDTRATRLSAIGVMYFWIFGAIAQLIIVQIAGEATGGQGGMGKTTSAMIACASGGVAIGAMLAALIGRRRTELGLVPLGGLLMALACGGISLVPPGSPWFFAGLLVIGIFSALFYVPLFAFFQEMAPEAERGRMIASSNLLNNLGMVLATVIQAMMMKSGLSPALQFGLLGIVSLAVAVYVLRLLPDRFIRMLVLPVFRMVWNARGQGVANVPATGGVLMVCNHVSYVDAFVLSATCPRPIRFLIYDGYYRMWWAKWILDIFGAVPIEKSKAHGAIKAAGDALKNGHVVCIFPEGKLTSDGAIDKFMGGMELILRLAPAPLLPASIHGLWGSVFSRFGGRMFSRLPRLSRHPVTVTFGAVMPATTKAAEAEEVVKSLFVDAGGR